MSRKKINKFFALFLALVMVFYVSFGSHSLVKDTVSATSVSVCKPSGCDYTEIQAAINYVESQGGGTVNVKAGTYLERLTLKPNVDVIGEGAGTTLVSGPSIGPNNEKVTGSDNVLFSGFTVQGAFFGIYNSGTSPQITNCTFTGNSQDGIYNNNGAAPVISGNVFHTNGNSGVQSSSAGDGIQIFNNRFYSNTTTGITHDSTKGIIYSNEFYSNNTSGIFLHLSQAHVFKNTFRGPTQTYGIEVDGGAPIIIDNTIGDISSPLTGSGIYVSTNTVSGMYVSGNTIQYNALENINFQVGGTATIIGNRIINAGQNGILLAAATGTLTVTDNYINSNALAGIKTGLGWSVDIKGNAIDSNNIGVWEFACTSSVSTTYNLITKNTNDGYLVAAAACPSAPTIASNIIDQNGGNGIDTATFTTVSITSNQITKNTGSGVLTTGAAATAGYNNIWNNGANYSGWTQGTGDISFNPLYLKDNTTALTPAYALQSLADGYGVGTSPSVDKSQPNPSFEDKYRPPGRGGVRGDIGAYGGADIQKPQNNPAEVFVEGTQVTQGGSVSVNTSTPTITGITGVNNADAGKMMRVYVDDAIKGEDNNLDYNCNAPNCTNTNGERSTYEITPSSFGTSGSYSVSVRTANQMDLESDGVSFTVNVDLGSGGQLTSSVNSLPETTKTASFDVFYSASAGPSGLKGVELYFRKGVTGSFTKYTDPAHADGLFTSSPISFNSSTVGGDGLYQFYSIALDNVGHSEAAPSGYDAYTNVVAAGTGAPGQINDLSIAHWNVKASTVELTWTAPSTSGGAATEYDIRYLHSYLTEGNWDKGTRIKYTLTPGTPGTKESLTMPVNASGTAGRKVDYDDDGLTDYMELFLWGSSPVNQDTDGDSFHDATETYHNFSPLFPYPYRPDQDNDTLLDKWEERHGLDPTNPDTDGDSFNDNVEKDNKYDPRDANPRSNLYDYDHDKLTDYEERYIYGTNPGNADSDNDGYDDYIEVHAGYDPVKVYCFGIEAKDVAGNTSSISNRACRYIY
ncbi:right-handed parallel beta-helix repeat-containing protein [Patescibacteria group bacterium]|nr:right-handed parallel beta-helix repeat-containing protein [Patescibacteria group bacterium]